MALAADITLWADARLAEAIDWARVARQLDIPWPAALPVPRGAATARVALRAELDDTPRFELSFEVTAEPTPGLRFGGLEVGGPVRLALVCDLGTEAAARVALDAWDRGATLSVTGTLDATLRFRLPQAPQWPLARVTSGDENGWIALRLDAAFTSGAHPPELTLAARLDDLFGASLFMPGADASWLAASVDSLAGELRIAGDRVAGTLDLLGRFRGELRPEWLVPAEIAAVAPLLGLVARGVPDAVVSGRLAGRLYLDEAAPHLALECTLDHAEARIGLHDILGFVRDVVRGHPPPQPPPGDPPVEVPDVGLRVRGFTFVIGQEPSATFELEGLLGASAVPVFAAIAHRRVGGLELVLGLGDREPGNALRLPFLVPALRRAELEQLAAPYRARLAGAGLANYRTATDAYFAAVEGALDLLSAGEPALIARRGAAGWTIEPTANAPTRSEDQPIVVAAGRTERSNELALGYLAGEGWRPLVIEPAIQLEQVAVSFPVQRLRDVRVSGTVRFTCEGPFEAISRLPVTIGLSLDMIYASVDTEGGVAFELPAFRAGYDGGQVVVGQLRVGFGYTKRSFALAFAGVLALPRRLVDDLDTSDVAGAGIRVPERTSVALRLDIIPFVLGKLVLPLPSLQFAWDLRRSVAAAAIRDRARCEPGWDGLQLVVPGVVRLGIEKLTFSPLLGGVVAYWNSDVAGDLQLGGDGDGVTVCVDEGMVAYAGDASIWTLPLIPILSVPFADDCCVALRVGGFVLGFDLQRPLPTFSPLAVFELLALACDPLNYPVAPRGELADTIRATLADGRLALPPAVVALFPSAGALPAPRREVTINLADYIRLCQGLGRATGSIVERALDLARRGEATAARLRAAVSGWDAARLRTLALEMAEAIPPALRQFSLDADLAGFRGDATLAFATRAELSRAASSGGGAWSNSGAFAGVTVEDLRELRVQPRSGKDAFDLGDALAAWIADSPHPIAARIRSHLPAATGPVVVRRPRAEDVVVAFGRALDDPAFYDPRRFPPLPGWLEALHAAASAPAATRAARLRFHLALLEASFPELFPPEPALVCAARVSAFGIELSLIGSIGGDGAFALVTRGSIAAPRLALAGCANPLPWTVLGRGRLEGQVVLGRPVGSLRLDGHADAELIPGVLRIAVGTSSRPATLELWSDGRLHVASACAITLFGDAASLAGDVTITHERIDATGALTLFHLHAAGARVTADAAGLTLDASLRAPAGALPAMELRCALDGRVAPGRVELAGDASLGLPSVDDPARWFALSGRGRWLRADGRWSVTIEGDATWQGLDVRASVTLAPGTLILEPQFRVAYTLRDLLRLAGGPAISTVLPPGLHDLRFQLDGRVRLRFGAAGTGAELHGTWQIALRSDNRSRFHPILAGSADAWLGSTAVQLVDLSDLPPLPIAELPLPGGSIGSGSDKVRIMSCEVPPRWDRTYHLDAFGMILPPYPPGSRNRKEERVLPDAFSLRVPALNLAPPRLAIGLAIGVAWKDQRLRLELTVPDPPRAPRVLTLAVGA